MSKTGGHLVDPIAEVWSAYLEHHNGAILSGERKKLIQRRLDEGYPVDLLMDAIHGNHLDPHCNGENDRFKQYHSLGLIFRDADHIERYAELAAADRPVDPVEAAWQMFLRWNAGGNTQDALDRLEGSYPDEVVAAIYQRIEGESVS